MSGERVLVDTNILVYAYDASSDKHEQARSELERLVREERGVLSQQNLAELSYVLSEKAARPLKHEEVRTIVVGLARMFDILYYDEHTVAEALSISKLHGIHFFDALLAATLEKEQVHEILTENEKDFRKIPWLKTINPFT